MIKKILLLSASHLGFLGIGFALGIYFLPILTAPPAPTVEEITSQATNAIYEGTFKRNLAGSDFLHWGEGRVMLSQNAISFNGELAPGPDYKLYLSPSFVETEPAFLSAKDAMIQLGDVKTFKNFRVPVKRDVDFSKYNTVVVWCESFGEFITAARYR